VGWEIVGWKCWPYVVGQNPFCSLNHPMSCWTVTIFQRSRVSPPYTNDSWLYLDCMTARVELTCQGRLHLWSHK
jgi:hypothetical protein